MFLTGFGGTQGIAKAQRRSLPTSLFGGCTDTGLYGHTGVHTDASTTPTQDPKYLT